MSHAQLRIVIVGHVDHGKSTLIGRLLHDTGSLPDGKVAQVEEMSRRRGMPFEWSFVMDALQAERDQGITIDTSQTHFRTARRPYVIIDAPGHAEFLKNMVTGASAADAALLVIDAGEGTLEQSRRHAYLLHLLGVSQVAVVINKMDRFDFDEARFHEVAREIGTYLADLGVKPSAIIPVSARNGDNIVAGSKASPWYRGPSVVEALDTFETMSAPIDRPLRFPVQDVYKPDDRRILVGRIESGRLRVGDTLRFAPTGAVARITGIEGWNHDQPVLSATAGSSVGITLDKPVFVDRGHLAHADGEPAPQLARRVALRVFWLAPSTLEAGRSLTLKIATAEHRVTVERVDRVIDIGSLEPQAADLVRRNEIAEITVRSRTPVALDRAVDLPRTGRGVLLDGHDVVAGFLVTEGEAVEAETHATHGAVTPVERAAVNGHRGGVLWMTGLSGSGKSTLAGALERALFARGHQVVVLDGDNLRQGLNAGLGFTPEGRAENVRRTAEVAKLFAEAGLIVIASLISPARADRAAARAIVGDGFSEVWVKADLATCEARDPKGLYGKARRGEIASFTGVTAPYEEPPAPDLVIDTEVLTKGEAVGELLDHALSRFGFVPGRERRA